MFLALGKVKLSDILMKLLECNIYIFRVENESELKTFSPVIELKAIV